MGTKAVFGYVIKTLPKNRLKYVNVQMQGRFVERPVIVKMTMTTKGLMSIILVENPKAVFGYVIKTLLANRMGYVRFLQMQRTFVKRPVILKIPVILAVRRPSPRRSRPRRPSPRRPSPRRPSPRRPSPRRRPPPRRSPPRRPSPRRPPPRRPPPRLANEVVEEFMSEKYV